MPRSHLHPFPKSLGHPNSMNKLTLTSQQKSELNSDGMTDLTEPLKDVHSFKLSGLITEMMGK